MLGGMTPIVRGQCNACGTSRNLWVEEMAEGDVACAHAKRGCGGTYEVAYAGPKKWLPDHLQNVRCRCDTRLPADTQPACDVVDAKASGSSEKPVAPSSTAAHASCAINGGLDETAAIQAALSASLESQDPVPESKYRGAGCALDADLKGPEPEPQVAQPQVAQEQREYAAEDVDECAICCDELSLTSAAMRCAGSAGRAHYFHAGCLSEWAARCRSQGTAPSCPECRGAVQVRRQKLQAFLDEVEQAGGDTQPGLHELAQAAQAQDTVGGGDDDGWEDVKQGLWTAAGLVGMAVAVGGVVVAVAKGVEALSQRSDQANPRPGAKATRRDSRD